MMTVIISVIVSLLFGALGPVIYPGVNFPGQNLFSQINSNFSKNQSESDLSRLDPVKELGNVTLPINNVLSALKHKIGIGSINDLLNNKADTGALKSALGEGLASGSTSDTISNTKKALGALKSIFILGANILVILLETVLWILKGLLGLVTRS